MCRKQSGIAIGRLCDKCDGKCPVCDSYVRPTTLVRICDECSFGNYQNKCVVCGGEGISDAFYCYECTRLEKDRDGCPKIINLGSSRTDVRFLPFSSLLFLPFGFSPYAMCSRFWRKRFEVVCGWMLTCLLYAVILPKENESASELLTQRWPGYGRHGDCGGAHQQPFTTYAFEKSVRVHIRLDWSLWRYEFRGLVLAACPNHAFGSGDISLVANEF